MSLERTVLQQECDDVCMSLPQVPAISRQQAFSAAVIRASGSVQAIIGPAPMRRASIKTPYLTAIRTIENSTQPGKTIQPTVISGCDSVSPPKVSEPRIFPCKQCIYSFRNRGTQVVTRLNGVTPFSSKKEITSAVGYPVLGLPSCRSCSASCSSSPYSSSYARS